MKPIGFSLKAIFLTFSFFAFEISKAQTSDLGVWYTYNGSHQINERWSWWNELQYRSFNFVDDFRQFFFNTGIGYDLTEKNNNLMMGYVILNSQKYVSGSESKKTVNEHRFYQQLISRQTFGRVYIKHRFRIEERFIEDTDFQLRFRYQLGFNVPLNKKIMNEKTLYASASNELLLNNKVSYFDQNRFYGGLGYLFNKRMGLEVGFMTQVYENKRSNQITLSFKNNIPFGDKKRRKETEQSQQKASFHELQPIEND